MKPKRHTDLFPRLCDFEHLLLAYKKARRGSDSWNNDPTNRNNNVGFRLAHTDDCQNVGIQGCLDRVYICPAGSPASCVWDQIFHKA